MLELQDGLRVEQTVLWTHPRRIRAKVAEAAARASVACSLADARLAVPWAPAAVAAAVAAAGP